MNWKKRFASLLLTLLVLVSISPAAFAANVTATSNVNVRIGPDNASVIVCTMPKNAVAEKLGTFGNWYEVRYQGKTGYVYKTYLTEGETVSSKTVYITASSLNVRARPDTTSEKIGSLKKGDTVKAIALNDGWYTIQWNGTTGYISAEYTSDTAPIAEKTIYMNADTVTVYAAPKTSAKTLGTLKKGASATYTALLDGWYTIQYNGTAGFIQSKYTTKAKPSTPSTPSTPRFYRRSVRQVLHQRGRMGGKVRRHKWYIRDDIQPEQIVHARRDHYLYLESSRIAVGIWKQPI